LGDEGWPSPLVPPSSPLDHTVAERKPFLLRLDPVLFETLQRWANDEVRSLNGQIEYLLTKALRDAGRMKPEDRRQKIEDRR
jgi:hypothetical protein